MYVNERDQINYHGFLRALREMHKVSQETVCKGICTVSGMNRFEKGNRLAEKLMRDRLTARLGISGEKYEDYLQPKEYVRWEQRLRIVKAIEERKLSKAKAELCEYEALEGLNRINVQFVEAMRFIIMTLEGVDEEELLTCIKKAVKCTVSNPDKALSGLHLLADQEINLIAEQMRLSSPKKVMRDVKAWRISEYEKLIAYIENSCWEKLQKAKVYPKIVYYICQLLLDGSPDEAACRRGLELCHNAIELLRDTSRLYYFIELTECRRSLAEHLMKFDIPVSEKSDLDEMLKDNNAWENVFKELYEEYKVAPYMSDFCYLYYETECHNMVEVIETRRNMLNLSRVKLGEGICSDKTIIRFEREGMNPSVDLVRALFEKMGLCAEYRRAPIIVADGKALMMYLDLIDNVRSLDYKLAEERVCELKEEINMQIVYNQQELNRLSNLIAFRNKKITREEMMESARVSFYNTISADVLERNLKDMKLYLTRAETECVYDMAYNGVGEFSKVCKVYIGEKCKGLLKGFAPAMMPLFEFLLTRYASELGDCEEYDESNNISAIILKECLFYRRIFFIGTNIYNIAWNTFNRSHDTIENKENALKWITICINVAQVTKDDDWMTFFQTKYNEMLN